MHRQAGPGTPTLPPLLLYPNIPGSRRDGGGAEPRKPWHRNNTPFPYHPPGTVPAKGCSAFRVVCAISGHGFPTPLPFRVPAGYSRQMPILFLLPIAALAALLAGWERHGLPRFLLLSLGVFAAALWLWIAIAFMAVNRPF